MVRTGRNTIIVDAYNANPTSMNAALDNFAHVQADRKIVMLGDMLELGEDSSMEHRAVADKLNGMELDMIILVGKEFSSVVSKGDGVLCFETSADAALWLSSHEVSDAAVLVKGSRGIRMEKLVDVL